MRRAHKMPFGAEYRGHETRFALWAPACAAVELELGREKPRRIAMDPAGDGWHRGVVERVAPGEAYAYRVRDDLVVPDPASRWNPWDAKAPSAVVDPHAYAWRDGGWRGRPWREAVIYELHVGTFTAEGTYEAAIARLDHLVDLGVTAIEIMPVADFVGRRGWGYDGVLPFAPDAAYGTPEDLKRFVDEAHAHGLMVLLDVVYNHFGPEGNYLNAYAPQFFNPAHETPWGAAINFDAAHSRTVRDFYVNNALYWVEEYHFDGLRLDAVHAIADDSPTHVVSEIAAALASGPGRSREVHLVLENEANEARYLERTAAHARAQWNDDVHHALHVATTGESDGYYAEYAERPTWWLARALAEGFGFQGEASAHRDGAPRGERSAHLPPEAFIVFLQNHDQIGNRALGDRITQLASEPALRLAIAVMCLAPAIPMLFMGEELGTTSPFLYFCDFEGELAAAVRDGRRREFAAFARFNAPGDRERIPDPNAEATFLASRIDWELLRDPRHAAWRDHYRALLRLRAREIVPRLGDRAAPATFSTHAEAIAVDWTLADGSRLHLRANFGAAGAALPAAAGCVLHLEGTPPLGQELPPLSGVWLVEERR